MARLAFTLAYLIRFSEAQFEPGKHQLLAATKLHLCVMCFSNERRTPLSLSCWRRLCDGSVLQLDGVSLEVGINNVIRAFFNQPKYRGISSHTAVKKQD
jgi:hypothetical protein